MELVEHYNTRAIEKLKKRISRPSERTKVLKELRETIDILTMSFEEDIKGLKEDKKFIRQLITNWDQEKLYQRLTLLKWALEIRARELNDILQELERYISALSTHQ